MKIFFLLIFFSPFTLNLSAQQTNEKDLSKTQTLQVHNKDKMKIILSVLKRVNQDIPFFKIPEKIDLLHISKKNLPVSISKEFFENSPLINKKVLTKFISVDFENNSFDYLEFSEFKVKGNKVFVSAMLYDSHNNSTGGYYEFTKINKKWREKFIKRIGQSSCSGHNYRDGIVTPLSNIKPPIEFDDIPPQIKRP